MKDFAIIKWTIWQRRWSLLWWNIGVFAFMFINLIFYPSFKDQAEQLQKSFQDMPDSSLQFIGGSTDFFSPVGYLNSQIYFIMLPLLLGILAIGLGTSLIAKEENDTTIDLLLTRPISRSKLLFSKAVAGIIILSITTLTSLLTVLLVTKYVDLEVQPSKILLTTISCFLMSLSFGAVAFLLSSTGKARVASVGVATLFSLGGYIISSLSSTVHWLQNPAKVFPFHYYRPAEILEHGDKLSYLLFFVVIIIICALLSWFSFKDRDISN